MKFLLNFDSQLTILKKKMKRILNTFHDVHDYFTCKEL